MYGGLQSDLLGRGAARRADAGCGDAETEAAAEGRTGSSTGTGSKSTGTGSHATNLVAPTAPVSPTASGGAVSDATSVASGSGLARDNSVASGDAIAEHGSVASGCSVALDHSTASGGTCRAHRAAAPSPVGAAPALAFTGVDAFRLALVGALALMLGSLFLGAAGKEPIA